jgi:transcription termination factor NusA
MAPITSIPGVGQHTAKVLAHHGFSSVEDIAGASVDQLQALPGFGAIRATGIINIANRLLNEQTSFPEKKLKQKKKKGKKKKTGKKMSPSKKKKKDTKKAKKKKAKKKAAKKKKK